MDFKLFLGVLKRYKRMVISGTVLAVVLSMLSYGTPGLKGGRPTIIPRGSEVWQGEAELLISQEGFPYGRAVQQVAPGKGTSIPSEPIGDYNSLASLSSVYAAVANGNNVQHRVSTEARVPLCSVAANVTQPCGTVVAAEVADLNTGSPLPLLTLTASAPTAVDAAKLATTTVSVLQSEITQQQTAASTPVDQRVELQTIKTGTPATLAQGYSKSIPILVLFAIMSASIALAFIRNNHSKDPVRSTRRRLDEGLSPDGGRVFAGAGNGHVAGPEDGWGQTGGEGIPLLGLRRGESATRLAEEENATQQQVGAEEPSGIDTDGGWIDLELPHFLSSSGYEPESRD